MTKNLDGNGFRSIVENYDLFFVDLWGVVHNGINLHKKAIEVLTKISKEKKNYILLTNAPRPNKIIKIFLEKMGSRLKKIFELWCLSISSIFSGFLFFYFSKMLLISYKFQERSEGADEILIWIPQTSLAFGSFIFFVCILHHLFKAFKND